MPEALAEKPLLLVDDNHICKKVINRARLYGFFIIYTGELAGK